MRKKLSLDMKTPSGREIEPICLFIKEWAKIAIEEKAWL